MSRGTWFSVGERVIYANSLKFRHRRGVFCRVDVEAIVVEIGEPSLGMVKIRFSSGEKVNVRWVRASTLRREIIMNRIESAKQGKRGKPTQHRGKSID